MSCRRSRDGQMVMQQGSISFTRSAKVWKKNGSATTCCSKFNRRRSEGGSNQLISLSLFIKRLTRLIMKLIWSLATPRDSCVCVQVLHYHFRLLFAIILKVFPLLPSLCIDSNSRRRWRPRPMTWSSLVPEWPVLQQLINSTAMEFQILSFWKHPPGPF